MMQPPAGPSEQPDYPFDDAFASSDVDAPFDHGPDTRQLVLVKHGQRFVFRYAAGEESSVLSRLIEMVRDPETDLNWFDAAVLSHQMGQRMSQQLESLLKP